MGMKAFNSRCNVKNQAVLTGLSTFVISFMCLLLGEITIFKVAVCLLETAVAMGLVTVLAYSVQVLEKQRTTPLTQNEMASMGFLLAGFLGGMMDFYMIVPMFERVYFKDVLIFILILSCIINYITGRLMDKYRKYSKTILILALIYNIGQLIYFKYTNFFISNLNNLFDTNIKILSIIMPIGISFFTFQNLSYIIDVYKIGRAHV